MKKQYVQVVLKDASKSYDRKYTYGVPEQLAGQVYPGSCVRIPFGRGNREVTGYVLETSKSFEADFEIKDISRLFKPSPALTEDQMVLAEKIVDEYCCTHGKALSLMLPPNLEAGKSKYWSTVYLTQPEEAAELVKGPSLTHENQVRALEYLLEHGESLQDDVMTSCEITKSTLNTLRKKELVAFGKRPPEEAGEPIINGLAALDEKDFSFTPEQKSAIDTILASNDEVFQEFLQFRTTCCRTLLPGLEW